MKVIFVIFVIGFLLFVFTAIRYRKQITGMIGLAKVLKETAQSVTQASAQLRNNAAEKSLPLVNCAKCGVWVPQTKARKMGDLFFCSDECVRAEKHA